MESLRWVPISILGVGSQASRAKNLDQCSGVGPFPFRAAKAVQRNSVVPRDDKVDGRVRA